MATLGEIAPSGGTDGSGGRIVRLRKQLSSSYMRIEMLTEDLAEAHAEIARLSARLENAQAELDTMLQAQSLWTDHGRMLEDMRSRSRALSQREQDLNAAATEGIAAPPPAVTPTSPPVSPPAPEPISPSIEYDPCKLGGDPYEVRPDDEVWPEIRAGVAFLDRYRLLSDTPDFEGAVADLNEGPVSDAIVGPDEPGPIGASIIVPVYGQLAYTLNCLDSLRCHFSHRRFEIIVYDDCSVDGDTVEYLPKIRWVKSARASVNKGFIHSCNDGAALARGDYLVMLNNDTRVVKGWLDEMIGTFDLFPNAGLVGSKLLYPDGSLQEAGGIVWRDGSAWNYGRNDDPNRPEYCYARQVDYISGASIALPADLWRKLRGFDGETYQRAYYEDNDMAFRVRECGHEVWMQPLSRIVHYEGKTSGTDERSGEKAYQVLNRQAFFARWSETLKSHRENGDSPWRESQRTSSKIALFIDTTTPTPDQDEGSVYIFQQLKILQEIGYQTIFAPEDNMLFYGDYTRDLQRNGVMCLYHPFSVPLTHFLNTYGDLIDLVWSCRLASTEKWIGPIKAAAPSARFIFNTIDLHFLRERRAAELTASSESLINAARTEAQELDLMSRADDVIVVSSVEKQMLIDKAVKTRLVHFPLMRSIPGKRSGFDQRSGILFLGGFRHAPNVDAVHHFLLEIWPAIRNVAPDVDFRIVGSAMPDEIRKAALAAGAQPIGFVQDLVPIMESTLVTVAPLRYGAGSKGKVLASLAHGVPVLGSPIAAEGIVMNTENGIFVCSSAAEYAAKFLELQSSSANWEAASLAGIDFVKSNHSLEAGVKIAKDDLRL